MKIIDKEIEEITPYPNNPRNNYDAIEPVANSIDAFGFRVPIIINSDGVIVTGHTRLEAAKYLGLKTVPCIVADDLTDDQVKAFRLIDNKTSEYATWDFELLESEITDIKMDMDAFGFDCDCDTALELDDDENVHQSYNNTEKCPKCGFEFEI